MAHNSRTALKICSNPARYALVALILSALSVPAAFAETVRDASHLVPTGKGWGESHANSPSAVTTGNGINYHGGPIMPNTPNVYFIWYGNWNSSGSNSQETVSLINTLFNGISGSGYEDINTTYGDNSNNVSGLMHISANATDNYSQGKRLSDSKVQAVVASAISSRGADKNGLYFVLTSSDVSESSGFCSRYCGWHTHATINGVDIKYSFVGNPDRCPSACEMQTTSPNGESGADGMASIMAHESEEAISDPDLNAWYDSSGEENADKCAWKFGPTQTTSSGALFNQTLGGLDWLIQMNWENASGGGCEQAEGGPFYTK